MKSIVALGALVALTLYGPSTTHAALPGLALSSGAGRQSTPTHLVRRADQPPASKASMPPSSAGSKSPK
ncbi:hypothetical protein H4R35_003947, partial [Dimargaris xerosporica]